MSDRAPALARTEGYARRARHAAGVRWITVVNFASGACSLIDEVIWVRLLKLTLGNTIYASSIVVSVFMGGLALGALDMSRYADRVRRRLRLYALLELLVTVSALALPWALRLADGATGRGPPRRSGPHSSNSIRTIPLRDKAWEKRRVRDSTPVWG